MPQPNASFLARWEAICRDESTRAALWGTDGRVIATFADIERQSGTWMQRLSDLPARSAVGIQMKNHPDWLPLLLALWRANHIVLPLDATLQPELTEQILTTASARLLIQENGLRRLENTAASAFSPATSLCKITSGTTGMPRLIEFTCDQLLADSENICATMHLVATDLNYGVIPFSHSYGFSNLLTPLLTRGISLVVATENFPLAMIDGIQKTGATLLPGIPVLYQSLARLGLTLPESIRLCITAGAPLTAEVGRDFFARNQRKIHSFYGASESGGICYDASDDPDQPTGFVGQPLDGVRVIHRPETGKIAVQSGAIGLGYHGIGASDVLADGIFCPSDILEKNDRGFTIVGRDSEFINIAGNKLDPRIVQSVIEKLPGVTRAILFAVPHERRGEMAIAAVETDFTLRDDILRACRQLLAPWQVPSDIWLCRQIPVTERGKINRRKLAQAYLDQLSG